MSTNKRNTSKIKKFTSRIILILWIMNLLTLPLYANTSINSSNKPNSQADNKNYKVISQNTIITLDLNKIISFDYEVYINSDGSFNLPFKAIAKLLDIKIEQELQNNNIYFTSPSGIKGSIDYKSQKITLGNKIIEFSKSSEIKLVYLNNGIMSETKNEIFVPIKFVKEILETDISPDEANYSISIKTDRSLKAIIEYNEQQDPFNKYYSDNSSAPLIKPQNKGIISLDTIDINTQLRFDSDKEQSLDHNYQNNFINNFSQIGIDGTLLGGDYQIKTDLQSSSRPLNFGGINFRYNKNVGNNTLQLGNVSSLKSNELSAANGIFGVEYGSLKNNQDNYRDISGQVQPGSKINVYINNKLFSTITPIDGYYTLKSLPISNEKVYKIKLEAITPTGEIKILKEKYYSLSQFLQAKGPIKYSVITGISGMDNSLFANNNSLNSLNSKKLVEGIELSKGITDKFTVIAIGIGDNIISRPSQSDNSELDNSVNLLFGSSKNVSNISGKTGLLSLNYAPTERFNIASELGLSNSSANSTFSKNNLGYSSTLGTSYKQTNWGLSGKLFKYSDGFYLAGTPGLTNDSTNKEGAKLAGNLTLKNIFLNGSVSKYSSILYKPLANGKYNFNEYSFNATAPFKDGSNLNFSYENRTGTSQIGNTINKLYGATYSKKLTKQLNLSLSVRSNEFNNQYNQNENNLTSNYSNYALISGQLEYALPKNSGKVSLMHDIVRTGSSGITDDYNTIRIGYAFPTVKGISTSLALGYHYTGLNKGLDFSTTLGYQFPTGRKFELSYSFNRVLGSFINNIFIPTSSHSSFSFNAFDALSLIAGGLTSIGISDKNNGYIQAVTFLDLNQNGIKDDNEPIIPNIPINIEGFDDVYTNKKGQYLSLGLAEGLYRVEVDPNKLPALLSLSPQTNKEYRVKIEKTKNSKVYFGLISSIGTISGKVKINDEFNRLINIKDIVVSIINGKGEEVKYTTTDEDGNYSVSGLSPGKYIVKLDKAFLENYHLQPRQLDKNIEIPVSYKEYIDLKDIDLEYLELYKS